MCSSRALIRRNVDVLVGDRVRERFGLPIFPTFPSVTSRERMARCLAELGEFAEGIKLGEEGLQIAEEIDHPPSLTGVCLGLGIVHMRRHDLERALPVLERGLAVGRRGSIYLYVLSLGVAVGRVRTLTGRIAEGIALMSEVVKEAASKEAALGHSVRLAWLAEGLLVAGEHEPAWERAQQALEFSRRFREKGQEVWTLHLLGDIAGQRHPDDHETAERFYREALAAAEPLGMRPAVAHYHLGLGEMHARAGRRGEAQEHLRTASGLFRDMGIASLHARAERQLSPLSG